MSYLERYQRHSSKYHCASKYVTLVVVVEMVLKLYFFPFHSFSSASYRADPPPLPAQIARAQLLLSRKCSGTNFLPGLRESIHNVLQLAVQKQLICAGPRIPPRRRVVAFVLRERVLQCSHVLRTQEVLQENAKVCLLSACCDHGTTCVLCAKNKGYLKVR